MTTLQSAFRNMKVVRGWIISTRDSHGHYSYRGQDGWTAHPVVKPLDASTIIGYTVFDDNRKHVGFVRSVNELP